MSPKCAKLKCHLFYFAWKKRQQKKLGETVAWSLAQEWLYQSAALTGEFKCLFSQAVEIAVKQLPYLQF